MAEPHSAATRVRPAVVTISSYLLIAYAVIQIIGLIVALTVLGTIQDVYRDAFAGTSAEGAETIATVAGAGAGVIGLLFAIGLVVLALLNMRGKNAARIVTWVVGGIAVCCTGLGLVGNALSGSMGGQTSGDVPSQEEINRRLEAALPSWYEPVSTLLGVLGVLALLTALILLALPKANEFFRKPQPTWQPPMPGATYPGTPGYPPSSGQPYGGHPHEPGYPSPPGHQSGPGEQNPPADRPPSGS